MALAQSHVIYLRGPSQDLEAIRAELVQEFAEPGVVIGELAASFGDIRTREPLRQVEWVQLAVEIAISVAGAGLYDALKTKLMERAKEHNLELKLAPNDDKPPTLENPKDDH